MDQVFTISDLLIKIIASINDGKTYKAARLVSTGWYNLAGDRIDEFSNHLLTLIDKFPNEAWNIRKLLMNPNVPLRFILNMETTAINEYILWTRIPKWVINLLYSNDEEAPSNETLPEVESLRNDGFSLAKWSKCMKDLIVDIVRHPNMTWEIFRQLTSRYDIYDLLEDELSSSYITLDIIECHPDIQWNWDLIVINPNLTWEFIQKYKDKFYNWRTSSRNRYTAWDTIKYNSD